MSKSGKLTIAQSQLIIEQMGALIAQAGKTGFSVQLMNFLNQVAGVNHLSLFIFDQQLRPYLVLAESAGATNLAKDVGKIYQRSLSYRHDPNTVQVKLSPERSDGPLLVRLHAEQISDPEYRENIYKKFRLLERVSLIECLNERWMVTNLYRDVDAGEFKPAELAAIEQLARVISALLEKNFMLLPPEVWQATTRPTADMLENIIVSLNASLSDRELQVCARALLGKTSNGTALELGIQVATVATLRKRAYKKLNISGLNELFSLCLGKVVINDSFGAIT